MRRAGSIYKFRSDRNLLVQSAISDVKFHPINDQILTNIRSDIGKSQYTVNLRLLQDFSLILKVNKPCLIKSGTAMLVVDILAWDQLQFEEKYIVSRMHH